MVSEKLHPMKIKMIATDLDRTLLREDKTISNRTISALKRCREKGIKVIYATGRGNSSKILAPSEMFDGIVQMNGAVAYIGGTLVYNRLIPVENVRRLLVGADRAGIKIAAEYSGMHYANFNVTARWEFIKHYEIADFTKLDIIVEKIYAVIEKQQDIDLIKKYLSDDLYLNVSYDNLAMVMHCEAKKSMAVAAIAERWNIRQCEIAAFGDDVNDIDLLQYSGTGIAVENALDEVKAAADFVCDSNENDGVAKWLEDNVL